MKIEDLVKLENEIRRVKDFGASSNVTITTKISTLEFLLNAARKELGEDNVVEFRKVENQKVYKIDTTRTKVYSSWQDPSVRQHFRDQRSKQKNARLRRQRQQERLSQISVVSIGNLKKASA